LALLVEEVTIASSIADQPALRRRARSQGPRSRRQAPFLLRPPVALAGLTGEGLRLLWRHRRLRIALLCSLLAAALLTGGWLWLRSSSLVSVQRVAVSGVEGPDARAIEAALTQAARRQSTLDLHPGELRAAVAQFPVVRDLRAIASFPHGLRIEVREQLPVAALNVGGERTAAAGDGVVLGPALLWGTLPTLTAAFGPAPGQRLHNPTLIAALAVLGAAPRPLLRFVGNVYSGPKGLTVVMRNGLLAYFGDATRPHAKWFALARVLADRSSAGASYVDVRLPERPAAGFSGSGPSGAGAEAGEGAGSTNALTGAGLLAGLEAALSEGAASGSPGGHEGAPSPAVSGAATSTATTEAAATHSSEAATSQPYAAAGSAPTESGGVTPTQSSPSAATTTTSGGG
jgi:cell division protein FtsQ